jgi:hypothetical protein
MLRLYRIFYKIVIIRLEIIRQIDLVIFIVKEQHENKGQTSKNTNGYYLNRTTGRKINNRIN